MSEINQTKKIVFIGNSIFKGYPYAESESLVSQYREATGYDVVNRGVNGDTIGGMASRFLHDVLLERPDKVAFLAGTNEFIFNVQGVKSCFEDLKVLVNVAQERGIEPILVTPISVVPEMARVSWADGDEIDYDKVQLQIEEFRDMLIAYGKENDLQVVDFFAEYKTFTEKVGETGAFLDGIHPTRDGYKVLAEVAISEIKF